MRFVKSVSEVADITPHKFDDVRRHIDVDWIIRALEATGTASTRTRRLPAIQVIWIVIAMALFRNRPIAEIVAKLDLALPGEAPDVANSAVPQARARLGPEPLEWLFNHTAEKWAHASAAAHQWRGLSVYGVDGSTLWVADSPANRAHFGGTSGKRGPSGYPLVRIVTLMALRSHLVASAEFGPYGTGEHTYALNLWSLVPDNSLTIVDKGFFAAYVLMPLARDGKNRHWLTRAKKGLRWRVTKRLGYPFTRSCDVGPCTLCEINRRA